MKYISITLLLLVALLSCDKEYEYKTEDKKAIAKEFFTNIYSSDNSKIKYMIDEEAYKEHQLESNFSIEGLKTYGKSRANNKFEIHRIIAQNEYVFLHVSEKISNSDSSVVKGELFKFNSKGEIIEHWGNIQGHPKYTVNGHTMVDGPNVNPNVNYGSLYISNVSGNEKKIFEQYDTTLAKQFQTVSYIQHNPFTSDGIQSFIDLLGFLQYNGIVTTLDNYIRIAEGDFSVSMNHYTTLPEVQGFGNVFVFDLQRSEASGLGAEHWDIIQEITKNDETKIFK